MSCKKKLASYFGLVFVYLVKENSSIVILSNKLEPRQGWKSKMDFEGSFSLTSCAILFCYPFVNMNSEKLFIKRNDFQENIVNTFHGLRQDIDFSDVTLV